MNLYRRRLVCFVMQMGQSRGGLRPTYRPSIMILRPADASIVGFGLPLRTERPYNPSHATDLSGLWVVAHFPNGEFGLSRRFVQPMTSVYSLIRLLSSRFTSVNQTFFAEQGKGHAFGRLTSPLNPLSTGRGDLYPDTDLTRYSPSPRWRGGQGVR